MEIIDFNFDFSFVNNLREAIQNQIFFKYTIIGVKIFAITFLGIRLLSKYMKTMDTEEPRIGGILELLGSGFIIISGDWIVDVIEVSFLHLDKAIVIEATPFNKNSFGNQWFEVQNALGDCKDIGCIRGIAANFLNMSNVVFFFLLYSVLWILDNIIFVVFLIERFVMIQFMKFVFPIMIIFSQLDGTKDIFYRWIKKFVGILILAIPYIAIYKICEIIQSVTSNAINDTVGDSKKMVLVTAGIALSFIIKLKLFKASNDLVKSLFN